MMYRWDPDEALRLIERETGHRRSSACPPRAGTSLESPNFAKYDTSSLTSIAGGGAPAPPALVKRVDEELRLGPPDHRLRHDRDQRLRPGQQRRRLPLPPDQRRPRGAHPARSRSATTTTGRCRPASAGEIWFKGPNLIRGYWSQPDATAETIVDGWLRTGDIGHIDAEGFVYVEDRAKDMVLRGGENVYSAEVEAAIYEHPAVYEAAVFGVPDERLGEQVAAAVVAEGRARH